MQGRITRSSKVSDQLVVVVCGYHVHRLQPLELSASHWRYILVGIGIQRAGIDQGLGTAGMGSDVAAMDGGAVEVILRKGTCREGRHGLGVNSAWP
jgi:hypothetical protein